jgi:hypothetical protein
MWSVAFLRERGSGAAGLVSVSLKLKHAAEKKKAIHLASQQSKPWN